MGVWKIYHKDGTILKDVNGNNIDIRSLEYSDAWMGECYLTVTFRHETPIVFMMGDYIIYRNEKFVLNYEPGQDKKARFNTYGDGFVYDSVKFNSLQNELSDAEFLDVVLNDNELHYTALPKFQFYVETLDDLLDRIQANLNEQIGAGKWKIFSRNKDRSEQRGCTADEWNKAYGEGTNNNVIDSMSITADTMTCWDALALVNSKWNVNFIVRGRNVYVGTAGVTIGHMFEYGRGNGLYEIEQNADSEQKVITRLRAYGSEKNLPSHYYADLGVKYVANITKVVGASTNVELELDTDYIETYFKNKRKYVVSGESQEQENGWVLQVTFDFQTIITGYVTQLSDSNKCRFYSELKGTQTDSGDEESKEKLDAFIAQVKAGNTKMYITSGLNKNSVPSSMKEYAENLPNNMSISRLMLPGFPSMSLNDYYNSLSKEDKAYVNPKGGQYIFSTDKYRPYVDSANISKIGLHSSSQFFDTDDKTNGIIEIYPTLEEMVIGGVRVDEINEGVAPADNGRFEDGQNVANVDIYLSPNIDFDITGLKQSDFSISMKDGMCGGRTFTVAATNKVGNRWRLTIERVKDSALDLWFPYQDYPIKAGDHFVLTGITLPDSYVKAASLKLLKYTLALLDKNDYTRYIYQPKVDELFMARQHDAAMADKTGAIKSLHDTLKAGDLMDFRDDDLNIKGTITIDQLNIKEQDGNIPTYEITLREDKEVGTIQKIQQQITSLESGNGDSGGGGGITLAQVKGQVASEGSKVFLSKLTDDIAQGKITFMKGLIAKGLADLMMGAKFGNNAMITELGDAVFNTIKSLDYDNAAEQGFSIEKEKNGKYHAFLTNLTIWGKAIFHELEVRKLSYSGGNIYLSGAGSKLIKVVPVKQSILDGVKSWVETTEDDTECVGWKCYLLADNGTTATMNYWQEGDQVRCQTMGEIVAGGTYADVSNKSYWRTIPDGGVSTQNEKIYGTKTETYLDEDGNEQTREVQVELYDGQAFAWIVIGKHGDLDGYTEDNAPAETKGIPAEGDTIVLDGNRHRDKDTGEYDKTDRQNVIILETTGEYAPRIACFANITEYKHTFEKIVNGEKKEVSLSVFETSPKGGTKINSSRFEWISDDGSTINIINYRGDWVKDNTYHKNDQVNHNNAVWVCVANSGTDVTEEPSDDTKYWKKVLVGGKGEKGDDAVSYNINFVTHKDDVHNDTILYVYVVRSVGKESTSTLISNIPEISETAGLEVRVYCDGDYNENLTNHVKWSGSIQRSAWETVKNFEVRLYLNDKLVSSNSYSFGEQGEQGESALEILVTPETLVFDTDDNGLVPSETSKQASISCYRNGVKVTNVSYSKSAEENCSASVSESNSSATVTISKITSQEVVDTSNNNSSTISNTSGYATIQVWDKDTNLYHRVQVKFMVNVAKFTGQMVNTNKRFSLQHEELANTVKDKVGSSELTQFKAEIEQTARKISLSVSEKSIARRNLLVGSDFKRENDNVKISNGARIEMNSGYQGTNCIHIIDDTDGTPHYPGAFWDGSQGGKSIKITKGKKYIISCLYKTNDVNGHLYLEALYTDKQTNAKRKGGPNYLSPSAFTVKKVNEWELFTAVIDTTDAQYDYLAFNFFESCNGNYGRIEAWICRPMVEEGDTYNGWTLSQDDYDIIGANLIDNSRTLDVGGNVLEVRGQKALVGDAYELTYIGSDDYNTFYRIKGSTFKLGVDYTISFEVRGDAKYMGVYAYYPITNTKFTFYAEPQNGAMTEVTDGGKVDNYVALIQVKELSKQQRVWSHFRFKDRLPGHIYFQFPKNAQQTGVTSWSVTITKPKIEVGAVITEYTERKSDLIDKASLKAAGIEITSDQVILYGNKVQVKNPKANPSEGYDEAAMFQNGKLNAQFINAGEVVAEGINAKKITATKLNVTGDSKIGIWHIKKVDGWGDIMQAEGTEYNGATVVTGIQYCPLFVRGGSPNTAYFRIGASCTEFSYQSTLNHFNAVWFGDAARIVCKGSVNNVDLPTNYDYSTQYEPVQYIYSEPSKQESPALAINVIAKGFSGTPTAIQTNGAIRGVLAPNAMSIGWDGQTIPNGVGVVICTNGSEMTLTLPANPLEGQTLIIIQGSDKRVYIVPSGDEVIYCGGQTRDRSNKFFSGMIGQFNIFVFIRGNWQLQWMNYRL